MGFMEHSSTKSLSATLLLPGFQARGTLIVLGMIQTFINDEQKGVFTLKGAELHGLENGNPATSMQLDELLISKDHCQVIAFDQMLPHDQTGLMPRTEQIVAYTSHYAIQGGFHMGTDTQVSEVMDAVRSTFLGITNVQFFPLFRPQAAMIQQAPLVYLHRKSVRMFHAV
ncbi:MAG: hypothetical protein EHM39_09115 [Chloroflexi bacterium]|nr:MAG: hypothetical protein EHM39_09115 [Chloroflexota bacterium]